MPERIDMGGDGTVDGAATSLEGVDTASLDAAVNRQYDEYLSRWAAEIRQRLLERGRDGDGR